MTILTKNSLQIFLLKLCLDLRHVNFLFENFGTPGFHKTIHYLFMIQAEGYYQMTAYVI